MKPFSLLILPTLLLTALVGCGGSSDHDPETRLRVVHASPTAPNVDVRIGSTVAFTNVPYFADGLQLLTPGATRIRVNGTGSATSVIDVTPTLDADRLYTVLAVDNLASITAIIVNDPDSGPGLGQARVRLVHGSPSTGPVDIYVTAPGAALPAVPTLEDVPFKGISNALTVTAGNYQIRITPANTPGTIAIDTGSVNLPSNSSTVAVALDKSGGGSPLTARTYTRTY
ncbi:MAG: DUF4397 domain-containing protein [Fimbriimonas sp.]